jgi:hypothetical protein
MRQARSRKRRKDRLVLAVALVLGGAITWQSSYATFTATASSAGNSWATGSLALTATDGSGASLGGAAVFSSTGMRPGDSVIKCITVTYGGTITAGAAARLYATSVTNSAAVNAHSLASYLQFTVEEGSGATDTSCTGFAASSTLFDSSTNSGPTISASVIAGSLLDFTTNHTAYTSAITAGWTPAVASASKSYRFTVGFPGSATFPGGGSNTIDSDLMGMTSTTTLAWEVRS